MKRVNEAILHKKRVQLRHYFWKYILKRDKLGSINLYLKMNRSCREKSLKIRLNETFAVRKYKGKTVEEILASLNRKQKEVAAKLRSIVSQTLPDAVETVKWGNITYRFNDKDLSWILFYEDHVDLGFFRGAELDSKLLEGTGRRMRHIKIRSVNDVDEPEITRLLKKAAELNI